MGFVFLALGLVLIVEGLAYALAPSLVESVLAALRELPLPARRTLGLLAIVAGLASVILGETVCGKATIARACVAVVAGSILYRTAIALALGTELGGFSFTPSALNLITAFLVIVALTSPMLKRRFAR